MRDLEDPDDRRVEAWLQRLLSTASESIAAPDAARTARSLGHSDFVAGGAACEIREYLATLDDVDAERAIVKLVRAAHDAAPRRPRRFAFPDRDTEVAAVQLAARLQVPVGGARVDHVEGWVSRMPPSPHHVRLLDEPDLSSMDRELFERQQAALVEACRAAGLRGAAGTRRAVATYLDRMAADEDEPATTGA